VLSSIGTGPDDFVAGLATGRCGAVDAAAMFDDPLPEPQAHALVNFNVRDHLGRKGTSFYDRTTSLAMVACTQALDDTSLVLHETGSSRFGVVLGTTAGSVKSTSDYSRETFVAERPYLVNPLIFPNAVLNCAAGQVAIRRKLRGVNATVAGGQLAIMNALRYSRNLIIRGYADALLVGAAEEFSPHMAWANHLARQAAGGGVPVGEGAAVFVVEDAAAVRAAGRRPDAEVLAVETGSFAPPGEQPDLAAGLTACVERALRRSGVAPAEVWTVLSAENGAPGLDEAEDSAIKSVLGHRPVRLRIKELVGECFSASSALQLAAVLARHRDDAAHDGQVSVVTSRSSDGQAGAAVLRGWSRGGCPDRS
jgi:3-oxoacyl-[acyl-carrier-protein] synthase II